MKYPRDRNIHRPRHLLLDNQIYFITGRTYFNYPHLRKEKVKKYFLNKLLEILKKHAAALKAWVILDSHYHLLLKFQKGESLPKFIKHLHGSTAHFIKKQKYEPNFVKTFFEGLTPWEQREWKKHVNRLKSIRPRKSNRLKSVTPRSTGMTNFSSLSKSNRINSVTPGSGGVTNFNSLLQINLPPAWYQYLDHIIRDEKDFYKHLNYIHQNPVKHGVVKRMSDYKFSSFNKWLKEKGKEWLVDCLTKYPIIDFEPVGEL